MTSPEGGARRAELPRGTFPFRARGAGLGRHGPRHRWEALTFQALQFRGRHPQMTAGGGFGFDGVGVAEGAHGGQGGAQFAGDLAGGEI
jgi:hypothetical protein